MSEREAAVRVSEEIGAYDVAALRDALARLADFPVLVPHNGDIIIKVNLVNGAPPETASVTHPAVVAALCGLLRDCGARRITIADGPSSAMSAAAAFANSGYVAMLAPYNVEWLDCNEAHPVWVDVPDPLVVGRIPVPEQFMAADRVINVPKMKTHILTVVTLALKNFVGAMPATIVTTPNGATRKSTAIRLHGADMSNAISDLNRAIPAHLHIIDGIVGMEGLGPTNGTPIPTGHLIVGANAVAVDTVAATMMGFVPERIRHIITASNIGIGPMRGFAIHGDTPVTPYEPASCVHRAARAA